MTPPGTPDSADIPTTRLVNRATLIAGVAAILILVTTVLPAEYGIDPTGIGRALGLTPMGEMKMVAAPAATAAPASGDFVGPYKAGGPVEVRITLAPYQGREVKATMAAGEQIDWKWSTSGPEVNFEFHGEAPDAVNDEYTSYERGKGAQATGTFKAAFAGNHGWYWKNYTAEPVVVTAVVTGQFEKFVPLG